MTRPKKSRLSSGYECPSKPDVRVKPNLLDLSDSGLVTVLIWTR